MDIKYNIEISRDGSPTISVTDSSGKSVFLHSRYSPMKEAGTLKYMFTPEKYDALLILGAGLGYHLIPLKDIYHKYKKIIIIDAIENIEKEIGNNPVTGFLAEKNNISILSGLPAPQIDFRLQQEIDLGEIKGISVIEHPASVRAFPDYYTEIKRLIQKIINKKAGDSATIRAFGYLYLKNILRNLGYAPRHFPVSSFFGKMPEYPSLVITSGPSIEKQIETIRKFQSRFFIVTVDSCAGVLLKNGIYPDFCLSIDPQPFIREHFIDVNFRNIIPVYSISSHPLVFSLKPGLLSLNTHPLSQIIESACPGKIGSVDSLTGTVAGDAINTARLFGFRSIALAGFDSSFPDYKIYPRGSSYQKRYGFISSRFRPAETSNMNYIMQSSKGIKHHGRFSRRSFIYYKESIEGFIGANNMPGLFNVNSLGIGLSGVENIPISGFIENFCSEINKGKIINDIFQNAPNVKKVLDTATVSGMLKDKGIMEEVIQSSIEGGVDEFKTVKLNALLSRIL